MKSYFKANLLLATILMMVLTTVHPVNGQQLNKFAGHWLLDETASDLGHKAKSSVETELNISQDTKSVAITRFFKNDNGTNDFYSETLPLDGKPIEVVTEPDTKKIVHLAKQSEILFIEEADYQITNLEKPLSWHCSITWTISDDGKNLSALNVIQVGEEQTQTKCVFKKQ